MATDKPLLLSAIIGNIEVEGDIENGKWTARSQYYVRIYVAEKEVAKSTNSKPRSSVLKWEWNANNQIWFEPSSMMKVVIYRGFRTDINLFNHLVGQHEGKVVDLLANNASFNLKDKKSILFPAKMKIVLSPTSESDDDIQKFMEKVDADVSRLPSNNAVCSTVSTLGQVLKSTKTIMDKLSPVHPILNVSWTILSRVYEANRPPHCQGNSYEYWTLLDQAVQETNVQDRSIRELADNLHEMLGTANAILDLAVIPNTTDVIKEISRQSLQVASLIHEYTQFPWAGRTVELQTPGDLESRVDACRKNCAALKDDLYSRLHCDTNTQVKEIKANLDPTPLAQSQISSSSSSRYSDTVRSGEIFSNAHNFIVNGGHFYSGNIVIKQLPIECGKVHVLIKSTESGRAVMGIVPGIPVVSFEDISTDQEIYKGRGYRLYSANASGRAIAIKVYHGPRAQEQCFEAAAFSLKVMHPSLLQMIGVSPLNSQLAYLVFNSEFAGTLEAGIITALRKDTKESMILGVLTVIGVSSGLEYLRDVEYPFASAGIEDFFLLLNHNRKILIAFNVDTNSERDHNEQHMPEVDRPLVLFHQLCQKTFDAACNAHYECQQIGRAYPDIFDNLGAGDESLFQDPSLPPREYGLSQQQLSRQPKDPCRRELVWNSQSMQSISLEDISHQFQTFLGYNDPSSSEFLLRHRRGQYAAQTVHRCPGYNRTEIMLTPDITQIAIVSHSTPLPHEICPVCKKVVQDAEIFNCICGNIDDRLMPTIQCSSCLEWHHRHCVVSSSFHMKTFMCLRCDQPIQDVHDAKKIHNLTHHLTHRIPYPIPAPQPQFPQPPNSIVAHNGHHHPNPPSDQVDYPMDVVSPQDLSHPHPHVNCHVIDAHDSPMVQDPPRAREPIQSNAHANLVQNGNKLGKLGALTFGKKRGGWSLGMFSGEKSHHNALPPVDEMSPAIMFPPSQKRAKSSSTDSRSLREPSPVRESIQDVRDAKKIHNLNKKEARRLHREAELEKRKIAERNAREQARAVIIKRQQIFRKVDDDFEWKFGCSEQAVKIMEPKGKHPSSSPVHCDQHANGSILGSNTIKAAAGKFLQTESLLAPPNRDREWRGPSERISKVRRREFDDDHSMSSLDIHNISRMSLISFATVVSDPGPSRLRNRPSLFGSVVSI